MPGGCVIGQRPIDLHVRALEGLGATVELDKGKVVVDAINLKGSHIFLGGRNGSTVTGTSNAIMAAVLAPGTTKIESAACEPEIIDLCNMLAKMGAMIRGIGSHILQIDGVTHLHGCTHEVIPDRIEAATYAIAAAITKGNILIKNVCTEHLGSFINLINEIGVAVNNSGFNQISVKAEQQSIQSFEVITLPYPGFPTDLQAQCCALACKAQGTSILTERVYPSRFMHVPELLRMGADISLSLIHI